MEFVSEIVNPLGAARGRHKVVQVFWTLADIPRHQRSSIDRLQLAMIVKEKLIKKYGYKVIYRQLIQDLKKLEEGILIHKPVSRLVKCGLLLHSGDNLESHTVGGFSTCFSSSYICRFCHIAYKALVDHIHTFDGEVPHMPWTIDEYDSICQVLESAQVEEDLEPVCVTELEEHMFDEFEEPFATIDEDDSDTEGAESSEDADSNEDAESNNFEEECFEKYGLRERCIFNSLQSFHAVSGLPPDIMHDLYEGVIAQDLWGVIKILSSKEWFTLADYNQALMRHKFKSYEAHEKPQPLPNSKALKLTGKAVSVWLHLRCFGMILQPFVKDIDDGGLSLAMLLSDISNRLAAIEFREWEIEALEELIIDYLEQRKIVFESFPALMGTPKCKHHYLTHYPEAIRKNGPPFAYWTGRFESKHRVAKSMAESAKNFKNISATLASNQQLRMASVFYAGILTLAVFKFQMKWSKNLQFPMMF